MSSKKPKTSAQLSHRPARMLVPRIQALVHRERLYRLMDSQLERPVLWVAAPPGAGKTAMLAGYAQSRGRPVHWLQLDADAGDPATLFPLLETWLAAAESGEPVPAYLPEYRNDVPRFATRFARALVPYLEGRPLLVFDNFQEADGDAFLGLFPSLIEELAVAADVAVLSRGDMPREFARLRAGRLVGHILPADLCFDLPETESLMGGTAQAGVPVARVQQMTGGWAAGIVLAGEYLQQQRATEAALELATRDAYLGYFAPEVMAAMPPADHEAMYCAALLPQFTPAQAAQVGGLSDLAAVGAVFGRLYSRHFFTDQRSETGPVYAFHALFRDFLLSQAQQHWPPQRLLDARRAAAGILLANQDPAAAMPLLAQVADWPAYLAAIRQVISDPAVRARHATVAAWLGQAPAPLVAADPVLARAMGDALIELGRFGEALTWLESAAAGFAAAGDDARQCHVVSRLAYALYTEALDWRRMMLVVDRLKPLIPHADALPLAKRIDVYTVLIFFARTGEFSPEQVTGIARTLGQLTEAAAQAGDARLQVTASAAMLRFLASVDRYDDTGPFLELENLLERPEVSPLSRISWMGIAGYLHCRRATDMARGNAILARAVQLGEEYGLEQSGPFLLLMFDVVEGLSYAPDIGAFADSLERLRRCILPASLSNWAYYQYFLGCYQMRIAHYAEASRTFEEAIRLGRQTGIPAEQIRTFQAKYSFALMGEERFAEANAINEELIDATRVITPTTARSIEARRSGVAALVAVRGGSDRAADEVKASMALMKETVPGPLWYFTPHLASEYLAAALERGIESDYARVLIARSDLKPPADAPDAWPWRLRVSTLGRLQIEIDGAPLVIGGKSPVKPLALLKLLASAAGEPVPLARALAALWPEGESDRAAFDMALARLKKLIGIDDLFSLDGGAIRLNPDFAWLDTRALQAVLGRIDALAKPGATASAGTLESLATRLVDLYRGPFLPQEEEGWAIAAREQWRQRFLRAAEALGRAMDAAGSHAAAVALYERAVEAEPLAEGLYRGLMHCHDVAGNPAEAIRVYRHCRQMLSVLISMKPSAETEALMRQIYDRQAAGGQIGDPLGIR